MTTTTDFSWLDPAASLLDGRRPDIDVVLHGLLAQRDAQLPRHFFYPVATDIDYSPLRDFYGKAWNNLGSSDSNPPGGNHTKAAERALLAWSAALFGLPEHDWWGSITTGGTAGNRAGLLHARDRFPTTTADRTTAVAYYSAAAHYSVPKVLHELAMPAVRVDADDRGEMNYPHLAQVLRPGRPAIVLATAGTTMTEAVDDTTHIHHTLDTAGITARALHVDAALSGVPLALDGHLHAEGIDSISVSGYKFFGVPHVSGMVVGRHSTARRRRQKISYIAAVDDTTNGSIDGLPALMMWYAVAAYGNTGHQTRAHNARTIAAYATDRLNTIGWPA
jgi:histidine decarboxylase